jgi:hypothetical protein
MKSNASNALNHNQKLIYFIYYKKVYLEIWDHIFEHNITYT